MATAAQTYSFMHTFRPVVSSVPNSTTISLVVLLFLLKEKKKISIVLFFICPSTMPAHVAFGDG